MTRFKSDLAASYFMQLAEDEIDDIQDINIVACSPGFEKNPPEGFYPKPAENLYWCPYCDSERHFFIDPEFPGYLLCEICHVSDAMTIVRKVNHMLDPIDEKNEKKKRRKEREKK
jgi:transcription antitermination factor NusG